MESQFPYLKKRCLCINPTLWVYIECRSRRELMEELFELSLDFCEILMHQITRSNTKFRKQAPKISYMGKNHTETG